jgi:hypothetical protein
VQANVHVLIVEAVPTTYFQLQELDDFCLIGFFVLGSCALKAHFVESLKSCTYSSPFLVVVLSCVILCWFLREMLVPTLASSPPPG